MPDSYDFSQPRVTQSSGDSKPLLTYFLCGLCVLVMIAFMLGGETQGTLLYALGHLGRGTPDSVWNGSYFYLVTSFFSHADYLHLLFNMLWLLQLGTILEQTLKPWQYALFLLSAALVSSCAELAFTGQTGIGASGVVYAMFGLMWAGRAKMDAWRAVATRNNLNLFVVWGVLCVFLTYTHVLNIGNAAHGAGFLYGLCIGSLFFSLRRQPLWALPLVGLVIVSALAVFWAPWLPYWDFWKGSKEYDRHQYRASISWYQRSIANGIDTQNAAIAWHNIGYNWSQIALQAQQRQDIAGLAQAIEQEKLAISHEDETAAKATAEENNEKKAAAVGSGGFRPILPKSGSK